MAVSAAVSPLVLLTIGALTAVVGIIKLTASRGSVSPNASGDQKKALGNLSDSSATTGGAAASGSNSPCLNERTECDDRSTTASSAAANSVKVVSPPAALVCDTDGNDMPHGVRPRAASRAARMRLARSYVESPHDSFFHKLLTTYSTDSPTKRRRRRRRPVAEEEQLSSAVLPPLGEHTSRSYDAVSVAASDLSDLSASLTGLLRLQQPSAHSSSVYEDVSQAFVSPRAPSVHSVSVSACHSVTATPLINSTAPAVAVPVTEPAPGVPVSTTAPSDSDVSVAHLRRMLRRDAVPSALNN
ncbi:MAG: hypothetical protein MHM6MM_002620 [Cercozoa sp. M6MM]